MASSNQPGAQSDCGLPYCRRPGRLLRSAAGFHCSAGQARTGAVLPTTCHLLRFAVSWKAAALLRARPRVAAGCRGCRCSSANRAAFVSRGNLLSLLRSAGPLRLRAGSAASDVERLSQARGGAARGCSARTRTATAAIVRPSCLDPVDRATFPLAPPLHEASCALASDDDCDDRRDDGSAAAQSAQAQQPGSSRSALLCPLGGGRRSRSRERAAAVPKPHYIGGGQCYGVQCEAHGDSEP
jgi:hypothetical protein